jgi:hypothetical protein
MEVWLLDVLLLLLLLQIPTSRVKLLVGPGGATIKDIQRKSKYVWLQYLAPPRAWAVTGASS